METFLLSWSWPSVRLPSTGLVAPSYLEFLTQHKRSNHCGPHSVGSVVSVSDSRPGGCEFDPRLRRLFFPAYFGLSPLQKHVREVVGGFGKKSCVSTGVRKPGNTCVTNRHDMTLAVKVA